MAVKEFRDPAEPAWEQLVNELKSGEQLKEGAITSEKLANSAVTSAKIANAAVGTTKLEAKAVTGEKVAVSTLKFENLESAAAVPAKPAEGAISLATRSLIRKAVIRWQVKAAEKEIKKVKHELASTQLVVGMLKMTGEEGIAPLTNTKGATETEFTYKVENGEEIEIKLGKEEGAKTEFLIVVCA